MWNYGLILILMVKWSYQQDLCSKTVLDNLSRIMDARLSALDIKMNHIASTLNVLVTKPDSYNQEERINLSVLEKKLSNHLEEKLTVLEENLSDHLEQKLSVLEEHLSNHLDDKLYVIGNAIRQMNSTIEGFAAKQESNHQEELDKLSDLQDKQSDYLENKLSGVKTTLIQMESNLGSIEKISASIQNTTDKIKLEAVAFSENSSCSKISQEETLWEVKYIKNNIASMEDHIIENLNSTSLLLQRLNDCPAPFISLMDQCFYLNKGDQLDFESARKFCQGMGSDLAQPKYPNALRVYIRDTLGDTSSFFKLGGSDLVEEGDWRWLTGESITEWWSPGQPDDHLGQQDCLYVACNPIFKQPFDDGGCQIKSPFICEYR
ncbi:unnamed protein product, partial [Meganyctiphanes norvegica]